MTSAFSRRIRVLEVMEATIGGTKRHLLALLRGLDRTLFDVEVAAPRLRSEAFDDVSFTREVQEAGIRQHFVPMRRAISPAADARCLLQLVLLMRRGRYDLVHAHSSKAGILARLAARIAGVRSVVYTPHGFYFLNQPP
ncbi:MAG: glycosyltransferase, partial [Chloroflexi bacterium]|nr:glycosyltransferase [Chloroflexota bacterium]